jgi:hypothetical protein
VKKIFGAFAAWCAAALVSAGVMWGVMSLMQERNAPSKQAVKRYVHSTDSERKRSVAPTDQHDTDALLACLKSTPIEKHDRCYETKRKSSKNRVEPKKKQRVFKPEAKRKTLSSAFIVADYVLLWLCLTVGVVPIFCRCVAVWLVDTALKAAPMLGVMGTMYSIGALASRSESTAKMILLVRENLSDAVGTTIMGIVAYIVIHLVAGARSVQ